MLERKSGIKFKSRSEYDDIKSFRKSIVTDLEDPKIQFNYLIVFMKICEKGNIRQTGKMKLPG